MSKISFEDIGSVVATFLADSGVKGGQVVKLTGNGQVGPCSAGDAFCGVALDGDGGVKTAESGGVAALVAEVRDDGRAVICL
mgnify:CR=1 FL=1